MALPRAMSRKALTFITLSRTFPRVLDAQFPANSEWFKKVLFREKANRGKFLPLRFDEHCSAASTVITASLLRFFSEYLGAENSVNTPWLGQKGNS
jgi:hypothetical protein